MIICGISFMEEPFYNDVPRAGVSGSSINKIYDVFSDGIHFAKPISSLRTNEVDVVKGVLQMLQGFSSSLFYCDHGGRNFRFKDGLYVTHLSKRSLHENLDQFVYGATCLQLIESIVRKVETSVKSPPTLKAFVNSVSMWLKRLRDIALKEEIKITSSNICFTPTLLGLANSLSSLCSGSEYLLQIVTEAVPQEYFEPDSFISDAEVAVHILDYLYKRLEEVCLVQGGEEEAYQMLLHIFVGSLLPYIEYLDSWLYEGSLDDPFEELFFYANRAVSVDEAKFWEKSYLFRRAQFHKLGFQPSGLNDKNNFATLTSQKKETTEREASDMATSTKGKEQSSNDIQVCPLFIKDIAKSIVSAGKSFQLIQHIPRILSVVKSKESEHEVSSSGYSNDSSDSRSFRCGQAISDLSLAEVFCIAMAGLLGHGDHIFRYFQQEDDWKSEIASFSESFAKKQGVTKGKNRDFADMTYSGKIWHKFLVNTLSKRKLMKSESVHEGFVGSYDAKENSTDINSVKNMPMGSFCPQNPVVTVCHEHLKQYRDAWKYLNISRNGFLPPLNDVVLHKAIFGGESRHLPGAKGTDYTFGFHFGDSEYLRFQDDMRMLEELFPFPTLLPFFQDDLQMSELLPFQKNSSLVSSILSWIQVAEPRSTPLPAIIVQECLTAYIKKQVDYIGRHILSKLMTDWKLMDELAVLRAVYLLGSGDLLQHFLTVLFNKLDRGETWDDDFELNMILQESIRNSADSTLLSAPDSLVVSITKGHDSNDTEQHNTTITSSTPRKSQVNNVGIDGLDSLKFTYKVSWPLELIANTEALKKYNQVMKFLLKVKRAKFVLDKARRWMWKGRGIATNSQKHHWLVEQKLLHFVDAFHQYVMDRVYHSAWRKLCESMEAAGSLDEVMEVHGAYLLSIQKQCFVVPEKLWALIASRINTILGLALDFYSIQQTLSNGGAVSAIKARCEMEVDRIERQFDDCVAFLLRVLSFKLNVGHFPHLADLVTRINYNYFYMSESGNLVTAPGSETVTSRSGKAFAGRAD